MALKTEQLLRFDGSKCILFQRVLNGIGVNDDNDQTNKTFKENKT
jgi:hypothetical protein